MSFLAGALVGAVLSPLCIFTYLLYRTLWRPRRVVSCAMVFLKLCAAVLLYAVLSCTA